MAFLSLGTRILSAVPLHSRLRAGHGVTPCVILFSRKTAFVFHTDAGKAHFKQFAQLCYKLREIKPYSFKSGKWYKV